MIVALPLQNGPEISTDRPVYISVTDFLVDRPLDLLGVYRVGIGLRAGWHQHEGAVGLWLWGKPSQRRSGSISVWRSEEDLRRFVRWPIHVEIMRGYRAAGSITSIGWHAERFVASDVLREARMRLEGGDPALTHSNTQSRISRG